MTWILAIAGTLLSLFFGMGTQDSYYQGICHGAAAVGVIWLGVFLMSRLKFWEMCVAMAGLYFAFMQWQASQDKQNPNASPRPTPIRKPLLPFRESVDAIVKGDAVAPDGVTEVECDLPKELRMHNTGGMGPKGPGTGAGLCVFTSIEHAGRYQGVDELVGLQKKMTHEPGGGYPEKVDAMLKKHSPGVKYVQHTGGDPVFLELALRTGRMPSVTYAGKDGVYYNQKIAHMVNLAYLDNRQAAILDNNYPEGYLWMARDECITRWKDMHGGWAVVLLAPPPPQPPMN